MKRRLADFTDLTAAEKRLRDEIGLGQLVVFGEGDGEPGSGKNVPPADAGPDRTIRAGFLRYLMLGGCDGLRHPVPETGVRVAGAHITGLLDLEGARCARDLALLDCRIEQAPVLRSTRLDGLYLNGSILPGLIADRLEARGDVFLWQAAVTGTLRLAGARLGGDLSCTNAKLSKRVKGVKGVTLHADGLEARGGVFLSDGFWSQGTLRLLGVRLGGDLSCTGAVLEAPNGDRALSLERASVSGTFFLRGGARVTGVLDMTAARFGSITDEAASWPGRGDLTLNRCRYGAFTGQDITARARIDWLSRQDWARWGNDFWPQPWEECARVLREMGHGGDARAVLIDKERRQRRWARGRIAARLRGARLRLRLERLGLQDREILQRDIDEAMAAYPPRDPRFDELTGQLALTTPGRDRILSRQVKDLQAFYAGLAPRLERAGVARVDAVMAARAAVTDAWVALAWQRMRDRVLSVTVGYGRRPSMAVGWLAAFWLVGALLYGLAWGERAFKPNNAFVLRSPEWVACAPDYLPADQGPALRWRGPHGSQLDCFLDQPEAQGYPAFNAAIYSADTLLPIVALEMQEFWIPDERRGLRGQLTRAFLWAQIAAGWALSLLAVAGFSGLIKSD